MEDRDPKDRFGVLPFFAEPPAKKYSARTIVVLIVTLGSMGGAMASAEFGGNLWLTVGLGIAAVAGFLVAKHLERKDRHRYGADRDSIAYRMKDW
jgi:hypothetical protein